MAQTLASVLEWHASTHGADPWLLFEGETVSWADALARARATAGVLAAHDVSAGDRFNVHLTNCPEFYDLWFAAALTGAVMVPTNPLLTPDELTFALDHAGCRVCFTQPDL